MRDRRTEGVIRILQRAPDRAAALTRLRASIDDTVLDGILDLSYLAEQRGDDEERLAWADLAVEASLHGGTSRGRADALRWHAQMHVNHWPQSFTDRSRSLRTAERSIRAALQILEDIGPAEELTMAIAVRARVLSDLGRGKAAFDDFRTVVTTMLADGDEQISGVAGRLVRQYWRVGSGEEVAAARGVLELAVPLLERLDGRDAADLHTALGDAYRRVDDVQAALAAWATARQMYADQEDQAGVFDVDGHLFEFAVERELYEEALALGRRCLAHAPIGAAPKRIAEHQHLLAAVKHQLGHADALAAYERAIELAAGLERWTIGASYRIEAAMLYIDDGKPDVALQHLQKATQSTERSVDRWLATDTIADLQLSRFDNPAAAIRAAEAALEIVLQAVRLHDNQELDSPTIRAYSLHRCCAAAYGSGDLESAYRRLTELQSWLGEGLQGTQITITATYAHPVMPPSRSAVARLSHLICRDSGRHEQAAMHLATYTELDGDALPALPLDDEDIPPEYHVMQEGISAFMRGVALARTDPGQAISHLLAAGEVLASAAAPDVIRANVELQLGSCQRRLGDAAAAKASYERGLALAESYGGHAEVEFGCRIGLSNVAEAAGDLAAAAAHLTKCVETTEAARASFSGVDERIQFLTVRVPIYERLIAVQIRSGRPEDAYATAQLIKSRTLGELLSAAEHRPIDYTAEAEAVAVRAEWSDWIGTYLDPHQGDRTQGNLDMLLAEKDRRDRLAALAERRRTLGLFDGLSGHEPTLSYETVRSLLRP
jgi:tetratricopeptide (TPR) repeat protein